MNLISSMPVFTSGPAKIINIIVDFFLDYSMSKARLKSNRVQNKPGVYTQKLWEGASLGFKVGQKVELGIF